AALEKAFAIEPMNFETAYALGHAFRIQSWEGNSNYQELALKAMEWYARGRRLNPYDAKNPLEYGMCLDWLERQSEAQPFFDRAYELDSNSYFIVAHIGWHYMQLGQYAAAKPWFERSLHLQWINNPIAENNLAIANERLAEAAGLRDESIGLPRHPSDIQPP